MAGLEKMPAVKSYLKYAEATRRIVEENYSDGEDPDQKLSLTVEENVLVQLESLRTHPSVAAAIGRGQLELHCWVYKFETGDVFAFYPDKREFVPLEGVEASLKGAGRKLPPI